MGNLVNAVIGVCRLFVFTLIILTFLVTSFFIHVFVWDPEKRLMAFPKNARKYCAALVWGLNIDLKVINLPPKDEKFLLVSNHMGFVDILMLASVCPMVFVTSNEMRETPVLGLIVEMGGCMFVERRSRSKILDEMKTIASVLAKGNRVALYPEAQATNGEQVLPFKRTLIMAAAHASVPIQPIVINFRRINGEPFNLKWRDKVCWYGDTPFVVAMWRMLTIRSVQADIEFLEKIYSTPEDDRGIIADLAHARIAAKFVPVEGLPIPEVPVPTEQDPA